MTLFQIAINNLRRRTAKMLFVLLGLVIGIATIVSIYSVVEAMKLDMTRQMAKYGANIVITADTGAVAFSYGGISIPEVLFDVKKLTAKDVSALDDLPSRSMLLAIVPKILGVIQEDGKNIIIAGSDLSGNFAINPWLRLQGKSGTVNVTPGITSENGMSGIARLDFSREDITQLKLDGSKVILGAALAKELGLIVGHKLWLAAQEFTVAAIMQQNGSPEDNQVLMDLTVAQKLLNRPDEVTVIELAADYSLGSEDTLLAQLDVLLPDAKITSLRQIVLSRDEMLIRLTRFGISISVLVLLAGMLVVGLTMLAAVRERTREIGIFRAIGFHRWHIANIILLEGIMISTIGGAVGYLAGTVTARIAGPLIAQTALAVPWRPELMLTAILLAITTGLLASLYPALLASKLDPAEALRYI